MPKMKPYADNFAFVIPADEMEHPPEKPFCWNNTCPCHEDPDSIREVAIFVDEGLMSLNEATDFIGGVGI